MRLNATMMKTRLGRAVLRALFCDDAEDASDKSARGALKSVRTMAPHLQEIAARAIAAEYLRCAGLRSPSLLSPSWRRSTI